MIIIDELQALDEIYFNGGRELLNEIFNFFVAMSKESHLCHVIIASSDGYFIDRIYQDSKLKKTSRLMEVEYIGYEDVMDWLNNLNTFSKIDRFILNDHQKQAIWDFFGGSCWEISDFLGELLNVSNNGRIADQDFQDLLQKKLILFRSMFLEYATIEPEKEQLLLKIAALISINPAKGFTFNELRPLVEDNVWTISALRAELNRPGTEEFSQLRPTSGRICLAGTKHGIRASGLCEIDSAWRRSEKNWGLKHLNIGSDKLTT